MRRRRAFTLVEVMAALAITGLLMASMVAAVSHLRSAQKAGDAPTRQAGRESSLADLLQMDLAHAWQYRLLASGFEIRTLLALKPGSLEIEHMPATVRYEVRKIADRSWLVRMQQQEGVQGQYQKPLTELVLPSVQSILVRPAAEGQAAPLEQWNPMPSVASVSVTMEGDGLKPFTFILQRDP